MIYCIKVEMIKISVVVYFLSDLMTFLQALSYFRQIYEKEMVKTLKDCSVQVRLIQSNILCLIE